MVFAAHDKVLRVPLAAHAGESAVCSALAEERFKEFAEILPAAGAGMKFVRAALSRLWPGLGAVLPVGAKLIVRAALFRIFQHFVGFVDILEAGFCVLVPADIRMIFAGQPAEGLLDGILRGISLDTKYLIIVFIFHGILVFADSA